MLIPAPCSAERPRLHRRMLAEWVGYRIGGLLNATLGNTVIILIAIIGLDNGFVGIVQSALMVRSPKP